MSAVKDRLGALRNVPLPLEFVPVMLAANVLLSVTERARKARRDGEKGAVSIEQAIITIAVIAFAVVVLTAIGLVVKNLAGEVKTPTVPNGK
ncbi:hypothetical protein GXW83_10850 [Streptacidiphilus sp. PB12-B1b]|uniref:hypothetical protein n=1 Tax=Streptacidiphilus sp. PB12-B1b TaxID=2705012 RepID=UPI0015FBFA9F|nr:hypothetical protein [Streptacidiphilus sp. PB12-B1b]QMU76162.1 hypothetical protein GXW83_10850 [Streptacidiphilus sp. PB12-B1b]